MSADRNPVGFLLAEYCRPYLHYIGFAIVTMLVARALWLFPTVVLGATIDGVFTQTTAYTLPFVPGALIPDGTMGQFWFSLGAMGVSFVGGSAVFVVGSWARSIAAYRVQHELRTDAYAVTQQLEMEAFAGESTGELMSILNNDVNQLESFLSGTLQQAGNAVFILLGVGGYMLVLNPPLAAVAFVSPVAIGVVNYWYSRYVEPRHESIRSEVGSVNSTIENNISGIAAIKAYTREDAEHRRIESASRAYLSASWIVTRMRILIGQITGRLGDGGYLLVFLVGGWWVLRGPSLGFSGTLTAGTLVTFLVYTDRFQWPMQQATAIVNSYQEAKAASGRVMTLFERADGTRGAETVDHPPVAFDGPIGFDDVVFGYDDSETLFDGLSVRVGGGDTVGIVGPSGAGKSTIAKLLVRFYEPDAGTVRIDGRDAREIPPSRLRRHVGYVGQDTHLFERTIRENVTFSDPGEVAPDRLEAAITQAGADEFIAEYGETDEGHSLDATVGDGGVSLSGGQRQRIGLARALYSDPEVLILDEATSHVDTKTELTIQRRIEQIVADRTTIVIAHRLSMVRGADRILVVEDGTVTDSGSHETLCEENGLYQELWAAQTGDREQLRSR